MQSQKGTTKPGLNRKCPKCGRSRIELVDHNFTGDWNGVIFWRVCEWCGHKWKEHYDFHLKTSDMPWKKPPNTKEWT